MIPRSVQRPDVSPAPEPVPTPPLVLIADEQALVARIRVGDETAFKKMVVAYGERLYDVARRHVDSRAEAEDLVQDVFCRVWARRESWFVTHGLAVYLYQATRNAAINGHRRRAIELRHVRATTSAIDEGGEGGSPSGMGDAPLAADRRLEQEEVRAAVDAAIAALPPRCREVYTLRWKHHLTHGEIARVLDISVKGVEAQLARGAAALRVALARVWP
jgi:RNA polymerase sigma-70 factor (ECF subfamily)